MFEVVDHKDDVYGVAFAPSGELLATASADATARVWRVEPGRSPAPLLVLEHPDAVSSVDFHSKCSHVCTASADSNVRVWNIRRCIHASSLGAHAAEPAVLSGHAGPVWSCAFSPSEAHIASTSSDGTIILWDWESSARVGQLRGHASWVSAGAFDPAGAMMCSASRDKTVRLWDLSTCDQILELHGHESWATCCAFGAGGCLFSGGHDKLVRMWDANSGMETGQYSGHVSGVYGVALSSDGHVVASASWDGTCRVWSVRMQKVLTTLHLQAADTDKGGHLARSRGLSIAMSAVGSIAVGLVKGAVSIFDPPAERGARDGAVADGAAQEPPAPAGATQGQDGSGKRAGGAPVEDWLVDALVEHLSADIRVPDFLEERARAERAGSGGANDLQLAAPALHAEYADVVMTVIDEVREAFGATVDAMAAAVSALARRGAAARDPALAALVQQIDAVDDLALFSVLLRRHYRRAAEPPSADPSVQAPASADDEKRALEQELAALRARLEVERAEREREAHAREEQRVKDLQARLDFAAAQEKESAAAIAELRGQKEALAASLEEERQKSAQRTAAAEEARRRNDELQAASAEEREKAGYLRAVEEMEAAAAAERGRRDEHDALAAKRIEELEAQRQAAEAERQAAQEQMQVGAGPAEQPLDQNPHTKYSRA